MIHMIRGWDWDSVRRKAVAESGEEYKGVSSAEFKKRDKKLLKYLYDSPYIDKIDDDFIGWPPDKSLGGLVIKEDVLGGHTKEGLEWQISERDSHPNRKGHRKIAEFIFDRLGYSKGLNKIGHYI